jgi:hypothetical protein
MAYVSVNVDVDVDLDEFDLDELLDEVSDRYESKRNKEEIEEWANELFEIEKPKNLCLIDQIKIDFLIKNLDRISINDLEKILA